MKKFGDRKDGKLIRDIDCMHYCMPLMWPDRTTCEAYMSFKINLQNAEAYIKAKNEELKEKTDAQYSIFQLIIAAILKTITIRTKLNRFVANKNYYQRNEVTAGFVVKKSLSDESEETFARVVALPTDTLATLHNKINEQIKFCKTHDDPSTQSMRLIQKIGLKHIISKVARWLDRLGLMPNSIIKTDPFYTSVILSNLGSIGLDIGYHHLTNWGTTSIFMVVGKKDKRPYFDSKGKMEIKKTIQISLTIDERIADGYYYTKSVKLLKKLIENPSLLEKPFSEEIAY